FRPNRRQFIRSTAALTTGIAVGCGEKTKHTGPFAGQELRIFVYAGGHDQTMRDVFVRRFEEETGATAILDPGWWDAIPKLKASPADKPPYDLIITDATQGFPAARDGMFRQLDLANVPNHQNLAPAVLDHWIFRERYGVTYPDSVMTLAYSKQAVAEPPTSWADLLLDDLRGKLGMYSSFYMSLYTFACTKVSAEGKPGTARLAVRDDLDGVLQFAKENRERVKFWWPTSTDMILGLVNRDCAAGNMHSPEMLKALRSNPELGAVVPAADRAFVQVFWAVPAGTRQPDLAVKAIDLIFSEDIQVEFARRGMATAVLGAAQKVAAEDPLWKSLYPHTEEQLQTLRYYPYDVYFDHWKDIEKVWTREVLRHG
ncbi:MAG TPA: extracellular solute-binding protein, partial [Gemmataceae bacterium]|nr:extracellular solute-binding protein [Gemmataceae bacterium]